MNNRILGLDLLGRELNYVLRSVPFTEIIEDDKVIRLEAFDFLAVSKLALIKSILEVLRYIAERKAILEHTYRIIIVIVIVTENGINDRGINRECHLYIITLIGNMNSPKSVLLVSVVTVGLCCALLITAPSVPAYPNITVNIAAMCACIDNSPKGRVSYHLRAM